jgi:hypothetical protein
MGLKYVTCKGADAAVSAYNPIASLYQHYPETYMSVNWAVFLNM